MGSNLVDIENLNCSTPHCSKDRPMKEVTAITYIFTQVECPNCEFGFDIDIHKLDLGDSIFGDDNLEKVISCPECYERLLLTKIEY